MMELRKIPQTHIRLRDVFGSVPLDTGGMMGVILIRTTFFSFLDPQGMEREDYQTNHETEQLMETVLENMQDAFMVVNRQWNITYVNAQLASMLQKKRKTLLQQPLCEIVPNMDTPENRLHLQHAMNGKQPFSTWIIDEQAYRTFHVHALPVTTGICMFIRDGMSAADLSVQRINDSNRYDYLRHDG